jgi:hypothetical protein
LNSMKSQNPLNFKMTHPNTKFATLLLLYIVSNINFLIMKYHCSRVDLNEKKNGRQFIII